MRPRASLPRCDPPLPPVDGPDAAPGRRQPRGTGAARRTAGAAAPGRADRARGGDHRHRGPRRPPHPGRAAAGRGGGPGGDRGEGPDDPGQRGHAARRDDGPAGPDHGAFDRAANVRIQGLRGRYTLLLSDGLPLYGTGGGSLSLLQVPPLDLGQVEIVKGAASALYGPSAIGGVVNLVSQRPGERQRQGLVNVSTQEALDATLWLAEPRGSRAGSLLAGFHGQKRQDPDEDGWSDLPSFARGVLRPRMLWDDGAGRSLFATVGGMAENRERRHRARGPGARRPALRAGPRLAAGRPGARRARGVRARPAAERARLLHSPARGPPARRRPSSAAAARPRSARPCSAAAPERTPGSSARPLQSDAYANLDLQRFDYDHLTPGLFAQDEMRLGSRVALGVSARFDHQERYGGFLSPRASLLVRPAPGRDARGSAPAPASSRPPLPGGERRERARARAAARAEPRGRARPQRRLRPGVREGPVRGQRHAVRIAGRGRAAASPGRARGLRDRQRGPGGAQLGHGAARALPPRRPDADGDPLVHELERGGPRGARQPARRAAHARATWRASTRSGRTRRAAGSGSRSYYIGRQPTDENPYRTAGPRPRPVRRARSSGGSGARASSSISRTSATCVRRASTRCSSPPAPRTAAGRWTPGPRSTASSRTAACASRSRRHHDRTSSPAAAMLVLCLLAAALAALVACRLAGTRAGVWAGALVALSPIHTLASRAAGPEAPLVLLLLARALARAGPGMEPSPLRATAAGLALGALAASGVAAFAAVALVSLAWLAWPSERRALVAVGGRGGGRARRVPQHPGLRALALRLRRDPGLDPGDDACKPSSAARGRRSRACSASSTSSWCPTHATCSRSPRSSWP